MKRIGAYLALLLGVFLLVLGLSVKFVVAPKAVKAPLQIPQKYQTLIATGDNFTMLNSATGKEDVVSVYITRHIEGDTVGDNRGRRHERRVRGVTVPHARNPGGQDSGLRQRREPDHLER